jgi:hypothetical protein
VTDPQQDDLSAEADHLVTPTGNGLRPEDPAEQPPQDPDWRPEGTESELQS